MLLWSREYSPFGGQWTVSTNFTKSRANHQSYFALVYIFVNAYTFDSAMIIYANGTWYVYFTFKHISSVFETKFSNRLCTAHNYTVITINTLTARALSELMPSLVIGKLYCLLFLVEFCVYRHWLHRHRWLLKPFTEHVGHTELSHVLIRARVACPRTLWIVK